MFGGSEKAVSAKGSAVASHVGEAFLAKAEASLFGEAFSFGTEIAFVRVRAYAVLARGVTFCCVDERVLDEYIAVREWNAYSFLPFEARTGIT